MTATAALSSKFQISNPKPLIGQLLLRCLNSGIGQLLLRRLNSDIHILAMPSPVGSRCAACHPHLTAAQGPR